MTKDSSKTPFNKNQTWKQSVLEADRIYAQVKRALAKAKAEMPKTPRRPDIRLIIENNAGKELKFLNPGNHSKGQPEIIPAKGDSKAVMVMLQGDTLEEQHKNATVLVKNFNLSSEGLSEKFVHALGSDKTSGLVAEAYGPAPYKDQSDKLVDLVWDKSDGAQTNINASKGKLCSYGARAATDETVFRAELVIFVKGTGTTPELMEGEGICIAVSSDWQTGAESTRPIAMNVARDFYGKYFDNIPSVTVDPDGNVQSIDLKNGKTIDVSPKQAKSAISAYNKSRNNSSKGLN
jgi:hypothetical protein